MSWKRAVSRTFVEFPSSASPEGVAGLRYGQRTSRGDLLGDRDRSLHAESPQNNDHPPAPGHPEHVGGWPPYLSSAVPQLSATSTHSTVDTSPAGSISWRRKPKPWKT